MAKGCRTVERIHDKEPLLRRIVCEGRYLDGQLYLDHCGRLLKGLPRQTPDWVRGPDPTPRAATLHNLRAGTQLGIRLDATSLSLDRSATDELIDPEEVTDFRQQVEDVLGKVLDELEVTEFNRVGYREQYYFSFD